LRLSRCGAPNVRALWHHLFGPSAIWRGLGIIPRLYLSPRYLCTDFKIAFISPRFDLFAFPILGLMGCTAMESVNEHSELRADTVPTAEQKIAMRAHGSLARRSNIGVKLMQSARR
jgi:hypothetical protein